MDTRTVTDELGAEVVVPRTPMRIVSLVPSLTETLWWFGLADRLVGITDYCVAPPDTFHGAWRVRGTKNPDTEAIVRIAPDIVIANEEENRLLDVQRLRDAGLSVYVTAPRTVAAAAETVAGVGALVGAASQGVGLRTEILRARQAALSIAPARPLSTFCPIWRDPWMATGRDTFAADLLATCGFEVVPDAADGRYPEVDLDLIEKLEPEVVLLPDEPYAFGRDDAEVFAGWPARVRLRDGTQLTWYGPRTPSALTELARLAAGFDRRRVQ